MAAVQWQEDSDGVPLVLAVQALARLTPVPPRSGVSAESSLPLPSSIYTTIRPVSLVRLNGICFRTGFLAREGEATQTDGDRGQRHKPRSGVTTSESRRTPRTVLHWPWCRASAL